MAKIMRAYNGNKEWGNLEAVKEYVRFKLGRSDGQTFLTELSPIPAGKASDKKWMTLLSTLDPELDSKIRQRKCKLKKALKENHHSLVICYGKRADEFAELLEIEWHAVSPKVSRSQNAKHLLLPFFGQGRMSFSVIEELLDSGLLGQSRSHPAF